MKLTFPHLPLPLREVMLVPALCGLIGTASAQQAPYYYQPPPGQAPQHGYAQQQRPGFGQRVGGFVKRMFYGEPAPVHRPPPRPAYQPGRSLDGPPSGSYRQGSPPAQTRSTPPAVTPPKNTASQTATAPKSSSTPPKKTAEKPANSKYTPPRIQSKPPAPAPAKTTPAPEPKVEPKKIEQDPPAPTPEPSNTPTEAPSQVASLKQTPSNMDIPAIKDPEPPATDKEPAKETPASSTSSSSSQFLVGKKTAVPGRVISPYPPYQELDVTGLSSGSLALDPTTDKVFEIP